MFSHLLHLVTRRPAAGCEARFVTQVRVTSPARLRNRRVQRVILGCWILIAAKCVVVAWLVGRYQMGFSPLWVNAPTVGFALVCTALYFAHDS